MNYRAWAAGLVWLVTTSPAWADIISPDENACLSSSPGAPCAFDAGPAFPSLTSCGADAGCGCVSTTCSHFIMTWFCIDGGVDGSDAAPSDGGCGLIDATVNSPCLLCMAGGQETDAHEHPDGAPVDAVAAIDAIATIDSSVPVPDAAADATVHDASEADVEVNEGGAPDSGAATGGSTSGCSCSLAGSGILRPLAPWLLAAVFALLLRRRRRER